MAMETKVYILLDIVDGKAEQVAQAIKETSRSVTVETADGTPDIVIAIEAQNREELFQLINNVLALAKPMTEYFYLLTSVEELHNAVPELIQ